MYDSQSELFRKFVARYHCDKDFANKVDTDPDIALRKAGIIVPEGKIAKLVKDTDGEAHHVLPSPPSTELERKEIQSIADELSGKEQKSDSIPGVINRSKILANHYRGKLLVDEKFKYSGQKDERVAEELELIVGVDLSGKISLVVKKSSNQDLFQKLINICKKSHILKFNSITTSRELILKGAAPNQPQKTKTKSYTLSALEVVIVEKAKKICGIRASRLLLDFDCYENTSKRSKKGEGFVWRDYRIDDSSILDMWPAPDNFLRDRSNHDKRVTTCAEIHSRKNSKEWRGELEAILDDLVTVLGFSQGRRIFCPVREVQYDNVIETTFISYDQFSQSTPIIKRGEDLKSMIHGFIHKRNFEQEKLKGVKSAIDFFLSSQQYNAIGLFSNLAAIEALFKTVIGKQSTPKHRQTKNKGVWGRLNEYLKGESLLEQGIAGSMVEDEMRERRNDLAHEAAFKGSIEELAFCIARSHEVFARMILKFLNFEGQYASCIDNKGRVGGSGAKQFKNIGIGSLSDEEINAENLGFLHVKATLKHAKAYLEHKKDKD